ncbi:MAG: succinate dehydrogenase cytochrome b subunit [Bryobacteraceae bacterium]|nr:succinate dehydrogenase cytochrome b subunit [Bryobacteraceae bacterium]
MMSAAAVTSGIVNSTVGFYQATVGKKVVVAVTGVALFGFVIGHMAGNLQVFAGPEAMNAYGAFLHSKPGLLWGARIGLILAVVLHIVASVQLALRAKAARPVAYRKWKRVQSSYASRTMIWSGPIIAAFVVYHLLHFTVGAAMPWQGAEFQTQEIHGHSIPKPYENVVAGFSNPVVSIAYIVSMALLCLHLRHGFYSMFQTVGLNHPRFTPRLDKISVAFAAAIFLGYVSIPIAVLAGVVR